ncbi:unnamed protein product [Phyllotreta striolata]|uniref:Uncharacterized protein n=1 Tax=Phyllotreta striolata TaxID=444603 RepID=A0A9N9XMX7_PHYSR|nr:unnamed protein product [Phyllotreta striolata]
MYFHTFGFTLLVILGLAYAQIPVAKILNYHNNPRGRGYDFGFTSSDAIVREESGNWEGSGRLGENGEELGTNRVSGYAFHYFPDGTPFQISYVADEFGFRPKFTIGSTSKQ